MEAITFDMLVKLPTKTLVDLFSERLHTDNQYEDRITFLCKFFEDPAVCSEEFKGYRNEDQVRRRMEEHMVKHRNELIKKGKALCAIVIITCLFFSVLIPLLQSLSDRFDL